MRKFFIVISIIILIPALFVPALAPRVVGTLITSWLVELLLLGVLVLIIPYFNWVARRKDEKIADTLYSIRSHPHWQKAHLENVVKSIFPNIHRYWNERNFDTMKGVHPNLIKEWNRDIQELNSRFLRRVLNDPKLIEVKIIHLEDEPGKESDVFVAQVTGSRKNELLEGRNIIDSKSEEFVEHWTFEWEEGGWKLKSTKYDQLSLFSGRKDI